MKKNEQIRKCVVEFLKSEGRAVRASELAGVVAEQVGWPKKTMSGHLSTTLSGKDNDIERISEGGKTFYRFRGDDEFRGDSGKRRKSEKRDAEKSYEEPYYQPFADALVNDMHECTKAVVVGDSAQFGACLTPDVIGLNRPDGNGVQFHDEIVSAEIKRPDASPDEIMKGFGQACAYRLFSHKTYLVIAKPSDELLQNRVESLCRISGIGLVYLAGSEKEKNISFDTRLSAPKHLPDISFVNGIITEKVMNNLYNRSSWKERRR